MSSWLHHLLSGNQKRFWRDPERWAAAMCDFKSLLETAHNPRNRVNQSKRNKETHDREDYGDEPPPPLVMTFLESD
jgi:hypothetical protein